MSDEIFKRSVRIERPAAVPARAQAAGFAWRHAGLEAALRHELGRGV